MSMIRISDYISFLPASDSPLSADVGIIHGEKYDWIFDVGSCDEAASAVESTGGPHIVILSHFHADHSSNLSRISYSKIYCSPYTAARLNCPAAIAPPSPITDGVKLNIFTLPSLHSKGAIGLEVNEEYAFLGDAVYSSIKGGQAVYNVSALHDTIAALSTLKAKCFLVSHANPFVQPREKIIADLRAIYARRERGEAYITAD